MADTKTPPSDDFPAVSIITPTYGRERLLMGNAYRSFSSQNVEKLEWIVVDDSDKASESLPALNDPRVRYRHLKARMTVGEKRNMAVDMATGDVIVQFDDDDYYAPHYVETMVNRLEREHADILNLSSFFLYSSIYRKFGYWNLKDISGYHFCWSNQPMKVALLDPKAFADNYLGYGFSYVFKKRVWKEVKFPHVSVHEDGPFIRNAIAKGFKSFLVDDDEGLCIHNLHQSNSSNSFPHYMIPPFLARRMFPGLRPEQFQEGN
jgi:glycosyltransferase involved in cell wall biosynthesis